MTDFATIETILDRTRAALMAGDLPALDQLAAEAEAALTEPGSFDRARAEELAEKAAQNERLILAAMQGIRAARRRAQDLTDQGRFSTYDAGGRRDQPGLALPATAGRRI